MPSASISRPRLLLLLHCTPAAVGRTSSCLLSLSHFPADVLVALGVGEHAGDAAGPAATGHAARYGRPRAGAFDGEGHIGLRRNADLRQADAELLPLWQSSGAGAEGER